MAIKRKKRRTKTRINPPTIKGREDRKQGGGKEPLFLTTRI